MDDVRPAWLDVVREPLLDLLRCTALDQITFRCLRAWGSSQVWRGSAPDRSVILKRGSDAMAAEGRILSELVRPLGLPAARLFHEHRTESATVLVLEDLGPTTLQEKPTSAGFEAAATVLGELRRVARQGLARGDRDVRAYGSLIGVEELRSRLDRAAHGLARVRPDLAGSLDVAALDRILQVRLGALESSLGPTVLHGDFEAKNLVCSADSVVPIDWSDASLGHHLGDLYSLIRELPAGIEARAIIQAYASGNDPVEPGPIRAQLDLGGVCWNIEAVRWIVDEGHRTVPDSPGWLDENVGELRRLTGELAG